MAGPERQGEVVRHLREEKTAKVMTILASCPLVIGVWTGDWWMAGIGSFWVVFWTVWVFFFRWVKRRKTQEEP